MKVIFLDIDGVLNSDETGVMYSERYKDNGFGGFFDDEVDEPTHRTVLWGLPLVETLAYIVRSTGAKIVISSTWRMGKKVSTFNKMFALYGEYDIEAIDKTPLHWSGTRGTEIQHWLDAHPEVTNYVILDDNDDMLSSHVGHFVQTDEKVGLTEQDAERAIAILGGA